MSIVKIKNKKALEQLQAKLTLRLGRKPTQIEILDYCLILANDNFEKLVELVSNMPVLSLEKSEQIIEARNRLKNVIYDEEASFGSRDDKYIYNE
ncbi:MAG: hypothetical protein Lokiarch_11430 [Candidatus Lokiarchaeum sp. GC14_75]|nr:MAG: hypothetical protein Lokiarch_11430 [Candidatus Lokiarchaeum sp. GC14_75]